MGHVDFMAAVGGRPSSYVFDLETKPPADPLRAVVFPFARKLTRTPEAIERADVESLRALMTDDEVVQLVFAICHFNTMNRLADAFGVPLETNNVFAPAPGKPPAMPAVPPPSAAPGLTPRE